jgi:hypothetical protein
MGFFTGASDALQDVLIEQERFRRQKMLDDIAAEERRDRREDRKTAREIQKENAASLKAQREQQADATRQGAADKFENSTAMGTELDDSGATILESAGRGSHIKRTPTTASLRVTAGLGAPTADNPLGLDTSGAPAAKIVEGKRIFAGTAKQQDDARQRQSRADYIKGLPQGSRARQVLEAQDATGDNSISASVFDPPKPATRIYRTVPGVGLVTIDDDGNPKVLVASRETPQKPGAPQVFYDKDSGEPHAVQFMPDGTSREVPLPAGLGGKRQPPAPGKTPDQIAAEAEARARGTAKGKASGGGGGSNPIAKIGAMWEAMHGGAPTATPAPAAGAKGPAIGERRIVNGVPATWDGHGWAADK